MHPTFNDSWPENGPIPKQRPAWYFTNSFFYGHYLRSLLKGAIYFIGYARIVLAILSFYFMPTDYIMAASMYLLSALLDELDGHAARYFGQSK